MEVKSAVCLAKNREKVLHCAKELFIHVGYQATSVDHVLEASGVAKSNFYYHFKSKEELAFAVLDVLVAEHESDVVMSLRNMRLSPSQRLSAFFMQMAQAQKSVAQMTGCPFGNFAAALPSKEGDERNERFRTRLSMYFRNMEAALCECLTEGVTIGEFREDVTPSEMAGFLVATIQGLLMLAKTHQCSSTLVTGFSTAQKLLRTR